MICAVDFPWRIHYFSRLSRTEMHKTVLFGAIPLFCKNEDACPLVPMTLVLGLWTKALAMYLPDLVLLKEQLKGTSE